MTAIQEGMNIVKKVRWPVVWDLLNFILRNKPEFPEIEAQLLDMKAKISILLCCVAAFILAIGADVFMGPLGWWPLKHLWAVFWEDGFSYVRMPILIIFAGIVTLAGLVYWASYLFRKWTSLGPNIFWVWVGFSGLASSMAFLDRLISPSLNDAVIYIGLRTLGLQQATLYLTVLFNLLILSAGMWGITFVGMKCLRNLAFNQMKERPDEGRRYRYVFMSMYLVISLAIMFAGYQITDVRGNIQREGPWKMYDTNPVGGTVISCKDAKDEQIACAITLWPGIGQNYSMFGDWIANVETGRNEKGDIAILKSTNWEIHASENEAAIPVISLRPAIPQDVEIWTKKSNACDLEKVSSANKGNTYIFFQVKGRLNRDNQNEHNIFRIRPENLETFRTELRDICSQKS